ncbi:LamG-like jellyroll fold domain-containing protein [Sporocytophaga myxococcoides]|nr:LamG-like jellyroll fold domain-containing protein [Sporocytophaga myxococcoides]
MKIIDYALQSTTVANPDGTMPATVVNCSTLQGPGNIATGNFPNALDLGSNGRIQVQLNPTVITTNKFFVRVVFKVDSAVVVRQNLIESNCLPFSMFIDKGTGNSDFKVAVSVDPKAHGWSGTTSEFFTDLKLGQWYTADLVYDTDTVALFIDGVILSVHAYPSGLIEKFSGNQLYIGTWVNGSSYHFNGKIAAVQLFTDEIPVAIEQQLDERRSHPEWFITFKLESIKSTMNFGNPHGKWQYDGATMSYSQMYDAGLIMYNESVGVAFEMHGAIFQYYKNLANKSELGYLVSDEINTAKAGGRKNLFSKGGIYWGPETGAAHVSGQLYIDYELFNESALIGWPISPAVALNNGKEQVFQGGRMYFKNSTAKAFEVHGAILNKFLATGGINKWGYPVSNESDVKNNNQVIGKFSEFESCTIYWSSTTGAFEVHGDIRNKYKSVNGPIGQLGFPTSDEADIPGASGGARHNTFQNGSILWFGSSSNMFVCLPFTIFLGRVDTKESEGAFMGQNDLYMKATLQDNGNLIYNQRFPSSGDFDGKNIVDVNTHSSVIVPNSPNRIIKFTLDVWESDGGAPFGGDDDHLGIFSKTLSMANAWGLAENNGIFKTGPFGMVNSVTWSVQPKVDPNTLTPIQKWWGVKNRGTALISYDEYASAFRDVDSDPEDWDLTDWLEKAFYELVIDSLASSGNCFGMSLEAIYASKFRSLFSMPLDRFNKWETVEREFNIKHQYQVGAAGIWWFVGQVLSGNTHNPVDVFNETRKEFLRGCDPVVCIAQNYDFSGKPHCILPVGWDSSSKPWKISILDPNFPGELRTLFVDPDKNEFSYDGGNKYKGGAWEGGRFHYMPYSVTNERPRTPIWDAIALLLTGTIIFVGSDTETTNLVDDNGIDLNAYGSNSINLLKQNKSLYNQFVSIKGVAAKLNPASNIGKINIDLSSLSSRRGSIASEMFMRSVKDSQFDLVKNPNLGRLSDVMLSNLTLADVMSDKKLAQNLSALSGNSALYNSMRDRKLSYIVSDKKLMSKLDPTLSASLASLASSSNSKNFKHDLRGINNGNLFYAIKDKLNEFSVQSTIKSGEINSFESKNLGTNSSVVKMVSAENKTVKLEINNKLGVGKDNLKIVIDKIPASAGKDLNLNIKPGLAGLDLITAAERVQASVSIQAVISGKTYQQKFGVDIEGGIRIRPSTVLTNNELKIGKIDTLFGQMINSKMVKGN